MIKINKKVNFIEMFNKNNGQSRYKLLSKEIITNNILDNFTFSKQFVNELVEVIWKSE